MAEADAQGARIPLRHISIRVPWHDRKWDGHVCDRPSENAACLALPRIREHKDDDAEDGLERPCLLSELAKDKHPPCMGERATFMADHAITRELIHPYKEISTYHEHLLPTTLTTQPFSAAVVPFRWMNREFAPQLADHYGIDYDPEREPTDPDWLKRTAWVQEETNQENVLLAFRSAIKAEQSLCIFCAKATPLSDEANRAIIGVGRVMGMENPKPYLRPDGHDHGAFLWEMPLQHSIRADFSDGFLMPYHSILKKAGEDASINPADFVACAPPDRMPEFSYACEHVTHDGAIASLLACKDALLKAQSLVDEPCEKALSWIDHRLSELWKLRGAFPGLGAALAAFKLQHANFIAYELADRLTEKDDPWELVDKMFEDPTILPESLRKNVTTSLCMTWKHIKEKKPDRLALLRLLSRMEITNGQAIRVYDQDIRKKAGIEDSDEDILADPYKIYEADRFANFDPEGKWPVPISLLTVDRAILPSDAVAKAHPLEFPKGKDLEGSGDPRRIRAYAVQALESAASYGHTLQSRSHVLERLRDSKVEPPCPADSDILDVIESCFSPVIKTCALKNGDPAYQLQRFARFRKRITKAITKRVGGVPNEIEANWEQELAHPNRLGEPDANDADEMAAGKEKAAALDALAKSRFSVLIGPAGTGKTTLLSTLCDHSAIKDQGVLLLAPTGKARVRMQMSTGIQAQTLAQFLLDCDRYDPVTGSYRLSDKPGKEHGRTVIVDEASMMTEDQLAALLDALGGMDRLILVGDPKQLPPIGAGRPFVDIVRQLEPENVDSLFPRVVLGYAQLTVRRRHVGAIKSAELVDLQLAEWFSGRSLGPGEDEILSRILTEDKMDRLRFVKWNDIQDFRKKLVEVVVEELGLAGQDDSDGFDTFNGGSEFHGHIYFNQGKDGKTGAGARAEAWQVLTPFRSLPSGSGEINRIIQKQFRSRTIAWAHDSNKPPFYTRMTRITKPRGSEEIVYGDKVINVINKRRKSVYPKNDAALRYVANGEIGIVVGQIKGVNATWSGLPKRTGVEFSSQQGYSYNFSQWDFSEEGQTALELAYAVTVHKAQGSEFNLTILVLPDPCRLLSQEMLYTALTRQRDRIVILHQCDRSELRKYATSEYSDIAARLSNLFEDPEPREVGDRFLEEGLIHVSRRGVPMRSKSEVIIADAMTAKDIPYFYEQKLVGADGKARYPDFTIEDDDSGVTYYWEHCGMLMNEAYRKRWEVKKAWYRDNGILPREEGGGKKGTLIETADSRQGGISSQEINNIIDQEFE